MSKCGTRAGWNIHMRRGEQVCEPCQAANTAYQRARRAKGGPAIERERAMVRAREAALWRLKDLHRADFDLLVADEMRVERARQRTATSPGG